MKKLIIFQSSLSPKIMEIFQWHYKILKYNKVGIQNGPCYKVSIMFDLIIDSAAIECQSDTTISVTSLISIYNRANKEILFQAVRQVLWLEKWKHT